MSKLIKSVDAIRQDLQFRSRRIKYAGEGSNYFVDMKVLNDLTIPNKVVRNILLLDDGSEVDLPVMQIAEILPDCIGVMVIFDAKKPPVIEGSPDFHAPHNAAIFNADGGLRFRLSVPQGLYIHSTFNHTLTQTDGDPTTQRVPINPPQEQYGVLIGYEGHLPDQFFLFDGTPELKATSFFVKY